MNDLTVFNFEGRDVRTIIKEDQHFWVAQDVCRELEITQVHSLLSKLNEHEKLKLTGDDFLKFAPYFKYGAKVRHLWLLNEPGLYMAMIFSRSKKTIPFKRWVAHEVLSSIREKGCYNHHNVVITDEILQNSEFDLSNPELLLMKYSEVNAKIRHDLERKVVSAYKTTIFNSRRIDAINQSVIGYDNEEILLSVTEIGEIIKNHSGKQIDSILIAMGFQIPVDRADAKFLPTDLAKSHYVIKHNTAQGYTIKVIRWRESVINCILDFLTT